MEISSTKLKFLNELGIDINNIPEEFYKNNLVYSEIVSKDEKEFIYDAKDFIMPFSMKDVCGTDHIDYNNMSFLESFLKTKRGDENINEYFYNQKYYTETLRQPNQSSEYANHDTPIELARLSDGSCYVLGGNNRIALMMMMYLKDISDAKTDEEKEEIAKKHTYYAKVKSLPKDREVFNALLLLKDKMVDNIKFIGVNPDDYHYLINFNGEETEINNKEELLNLLFKIYDIKDIKDSIILYETLFLIISNYNEYIGKGQTEKINLLSKIIPDIEEIKNKFLELRRITVSRNVFDIVDISKLNYSNLKNYLIEIINVEQNKRDEEVLEKLEEEFKNCNNIDDLIRVVNKIDNINSDFKDKINEYFPDYLLISNYIKNNDVILPEDFFEINNSYSEIYNSILKIIIEDKEKELASSNEKLMELENKKQELLLERNVVTNFIICEELVHKTEGLNNNLNEITDNLLIEEEKISDIESKIDKKRIEVKNIDNKNFIIKLFKAKVLKTLNDELEELEKEKNNTINGIENINKDKEKLVLEKEQVISELYKLLGQNIELDKLKDLFLYCVQQNFTVEGLDNLIEDVNLSIRNLDVEGKETYLNELISKYQLINNNELENNKSFN